MKALVLLSGGVDSATCLGIAVDKYGAENVIALAVYYGQKHSRELMAAENVAEYYGVKLKKLDLALIFADSDCSPRQLRIYRKNPMLNSSKRPAELRYRPMCRSETDFSFRPQQVSL